MREIWRRGNNNFYSSIYIFYGLIIILIEIVELKI